MSGKELPKIVDKSPAEIEAAIATIESSNLLPDIKDFAISCVRLAIWLPNALLSHQITISNLRKLVFGQGNNKNHRNKKHKNNKDNSVKDNSVKDNLSTSGNENAADDNQSVNNGKTKNEHEPKARGLWRNVYSLYQSGMNLSGVSGEVCK